MTNDFCTIAKPIYISKQDVLTDGTVDQLLRHNEVWKKLCN